jgi:hypothetical protein
MLSLTKMVPVKKLLLLLRALALSHLMLLLRTLVLIHMLLLLLRALALSQLLAFTIAFPFFSWERVVEQHQLHSSSTPARTNNRGLM